MAGLKRQFVCLSIVTLCIGLCAADSFQVNWFTIANGSETSAGNGFSVSATVGQAGAGEQMTGGSFEVVSGFWAGVDSEEQKLARGDMNCDGAIDFEDIDSFVIALISRESYESDFPDCNYLNADIDRNGSVDFADIDGFIECLINGGCE